MQNIPQNPAVWTEIKVTDMEAAKAFYAAVFAFEILDMTMGDASTTSFAYAGDYGVSAQLMLGTPAPRGSGNVIHLQIAGALEDAITRLNKAGGTATSDILTAPPGRFIYAEDPDGNAIGLFEPKAA